MAHSLNTYDRAGVVHSVKDKPNNERLGRTHCELTFSWPIYGALSATRWTGTHDHVTCLSCIGR